MIALHHQALLVCFADGHIEPLNMHDLVSHLVDDFPKARDNLEPWVVEKAVESLIRHFRENSKRDRISLGEFISTARMLLASFVREAMAPRERGHQLDLFLTAKGCGFGFELEFFKEVRRFLHQKTNPMTPRIPPNLVIPKMLQSQSEAAGEKSSRPVRFTGLHRCAKFLAGRRRWSKRCSEVRDEIVAFIRDEIARSRSAQLAVSILP